MKTATKDAADARALFFDETTPEATLEAYLPRFAADAQIGLNLRDFNANLPSNAANAGRASWLGSAPPLQVLGAGRDAVVDREGVEETASFLGTNAEFFETLPHDVMLCDGWETPADRVIAFAKGL